MNPLLNAARLFVAGAFASLLVGCGGGGGGGGSNGFRVSLQTTSVAFDYLRGDRPPPQTIRATWSGEPPGNLYVAAIVEGTGINPSIVISIEGASATATVQPAANLAAGSYTGRILFLVCTDAPCTQRVGGSPLPVSYRIDVRPAIFDAPESMSFQYMYGTTPSGSVQVTVAANAGAWTATPSVPWIVLSKTSGNGADVITVTFDPLVVPGGSGGGFNGNVQFNSAAGSRTVPTTLTVTKPTLVASQGSLNFAGINGTPVAAQAMTISLSHATALPVSVSSNRPWLRYSTSGANTPQSITVSVDPSTGPLASGTHSGALHIEAGNGTNNIALDVPVALMLTPPQLTVSPSSIVLGGAAGRSFASVPMSLTLDTGGNAYQWNMTPPPNWMITDRISGVTSATGQTVTFTPDRTQLSPGTATTSLRFTATVNGDSLVRDVPVSFNLDTHRLIASENGVALVTTPNLAWRRLTRTINVRSNFGLPVAWNAVSDAAWLAVTPSGVAGNSLTITANPTGLNDDQLYTATVTISSPDGSIGGDERIRVGLWVGSSTVTNRYSIWQGFPNTSYGSMIADPIRPYAYIHMGEDIGIFNLYTHTTVAMISGIAPNFDRSRVRAMAISSDGDRLYAFDANDRVIVPIDLNTLTRLPSYPAFNANNSNPLDYIKYVRLNGVGLIMGRTEKVYLADTGAGFDNAVVGLTGAPADGHHVFLHNMRIDVDFTSAGGNTFLRSYEPTFIQLGELSIGANGYTASNADGSRIYLAQEKLLSYNGQTMTASSQIHEPGVRFINAVVGSNGVVAASSLFFVQGYTEDVFVYSEAGAVLTKFKADQSTPTNGPARNSLIVSGDGFIVATGSQSGTLEVLPVFP